MDIFFFKQKTAYEMRISDWSSDVCSSDLRQRPCIAVRRTEEIGRAGRLDDRGGRHMFGARVFDDARERHRRGGLARMIGHHHRAMIVRGVLVGGAALPVLHSRQPAHFGADGAKAARPDVGPWTDRKSTRLNSSS